MWQELVRALPYAVRDAVIASMPAMITAVCFVWHQRRQGLQMIKAMLESMHPTII